MDTKHQKLVDVLRQAHRLLAKPENDFVWSSWENTAAALSEIENIITSIESGKLPHRSEIEVLFAPTGPIQEVSLSSGWGNDFLNLAARFDQAISCAYDNNLVPWFKRY